MVNIILFAALCLQIICSITIGCRYAQLGRHHTMCVYRAHSCPNSQLLRSGGLVQADKNLILHIHNKLRSNVANGKIQGLPAAVNMRFMVWDNELARIAQRWADQCGEGHDRSRDTSEFQVGQNVALHWTFNHKDSKMKDRPDWTSMIDLWKNEYNEYGFYRNQIDPFVFSYNVGHFTQMIWGDTYKIGCGFTYFKHPHKGYTKIYVCNYGSGGNIIGDRMYEIAKGNKKCTNPNLTPSHQYQGLCEKHSHYRIRRRNTKSIPKNKARRIQWKGENVRHVRQ